jgi:hypothetical protein
MDLNRKGVVPLAHKDILHIGLILKNHPHPTSGEKVENRKVTQGQLPFFSIHAKIVL